jgi:hypothetical protein
VVKSGRLLLLQDFKISVLETAGAIFHIQIASFEKPDTFLTGPFCSKMISRISGHVKTTTGATWNGNSFRWVQTYCKPNQTKY